MLGPNEERGLSPLALKGVRRTLSFYREMPTVPEEGRVDATLWEMCDLEAELLAVRIELLYEEAKERLEWPFD